MLKEKASLLQKHDEELFGKKFRNHIADTMKSKKQTREIFVERDSKKPFPYSPSQPPRRSEGPKFYLSKTGGNPKYQHQNGSFQSQQRNNQQQRGGYHHGKNKYSTANLPQHTLKLENKNILGVKKCSPIDKKVILIKEHSKCYFSMTAKAFCASMGKNHSRSKYFGHSERLQNTVSLRTFPVSSPLPDSSKLGAERIDRKRGEGNAEEGSCNESRPNKRGIFEQPFSSKEEGSGPKACHKSEISKFFYPIPSFQDGGFTKSQIYAAKGRLHVQTGSQGCILLHPNRREFQKVSSISVVRELVRVSLPVLWFGSSTENFCKIVKSSHFYLTQDQYKNNNLSRRYAANGAYIRGNNDESGHSNLPLAASGICHKLGKVCVNTSEGDRIFGSQHKFHNNGNFFHPRKIPESKIRMSEIDRPENSIDFRINKTNWIVDVNNSSSITSKDKLPIPANTTNIIFKGKPFLFRPSYFEQKFQDGIKVVDRKSGSLQWQEPNSTTSTGVDTNRKVLEGIASRKG